MASTFSGKLTPSSSHFNASTSGQFWRRCWGDGSRHGPEGHLLTAPLAWLGWITRSDSWLFPGEFASVEHTLESIILTGFPDNSEHLSGLWINGQIIYLQALEIAIIIFSPDFKSPLKKYLSVLDQLVLKACRRKLGVWWAGSREAVGRSWVENGAGEAWAMRTWPLDRSAQSQLWVSEHSW